MQDEKKTKRQLITELAEMRQKFAMLEKSDSDYARTEAALSESEEKFRNIAETAVDAIVLASGEGNIIFWNKSAQQIFGYSEEEILGKPLTVLMPEQYREDHRRGMNRMTSTGESKYFGRITEMQGITKDGSVFPIELSVSMWKKVEGMFFSAIIRDITKRKRLESDLEIMATTDKLTQAFNRTKFYKEIKKEFERARRYGHPLSIIMFDIDHFKGVNDRYGHSVGDYVLQTLTRIVRENLREVDYLIRWGGEEFNIITPDTDMKSAEVLAERIRRSVESYRFEQAGTVTISLGVAQFMYDDNEDTFIKRADDAMYLAKKRGRNRVEVSA
jgi:two-component system, cell cycle response regulator